MRIAVLGPLLDTSKKYLDGCSLTELFTSVLLSYLCNQYLTKSKLEEEGF